MRCSQDAVSDVGYEYGVDQRSEELDGRGLQSVEQRSGGTVLRVRVVQGGASRGIEGRVEEKQHSAGQ